MRLSGIEPAVGRVVAMIPAALLVLLTGILVLLALPCGKDRRTYALVASTVAMRTLAALLRASPGRRGQLPPPPQESVIVSGVTHAPLPELTTTSEAAKLLREQAQQVSDLLEVLSQSPFIHLDDGEF